MEEGSKGKKQGRAMCGDIIAQFLSCRVHISCTHVTCNQRGRSGEGLVCGVKDSNGWKETD